MDPSRALRGRQPGSAAGCGAGGLRLADVERRLSGRQARLVRLPRADREPARAYRFLFGNDPATVISIGSHGFSVLELRDKGTKSSGKTAAVRKGPTILRQLTERFGLDVGGRAHLAPMFDYARFRGDAGDPEDGYDAPG